MASTGGLCPAPETYGGDRTLQRLIEAFAAARGSAFAGNDDSLIAAENEAFARVLFIAWNQQRRAKNQFNPLTCTDFLPRWEAIFALTPLPGDTLPMRRQALANAWARFGVRATRQALRDRLTTALGDVFIDVSTVDPSLASVSWPGGTVLPGTAGWSSTVAKLNVQLQWPAWMPLGQFLQLAATVGPTIESLLPAWMDFQWFILGPSGAGFFLGDTYNLGFELVA